MSWKQALAFATLALAWGSSFLWIKLAVQEVGPLTLVGYRLSFGIVGLLALIAFKRPALPRRARDWVGLAFLGIINTAIPFTLISWGEQSIDSAVASILNGTVPFFTLLIAHLALSDERMTLQRWLGLLAGFGGVVLLLSRDLSWGQFRADLLGQLAILGAAVSYAIGIVHARRNLGGIAPLTQALVSVGVADAFIWTAALNAESGNLVPAQPLTWLALGWLGLLGTGLAYALYYYLVQSIGPSRTSMVTYVMPVIGVALGVAFLGEPLSWQLGAGAALILSGVWIVNRRRRLAPQRDQTPDPNRAS